MEDPRPAQPPAPPTVIVQPRESMFGRFGKFLLIALAICVFALMGTAASVQQYYGDGTGPTEKYYSLSKTATDKIALVNISGAIMEGSDYVEEQLDRIAEDESVVAAVLWIDSPGGTVTKSNRIYHHAKRVFEQREIPCVVSMGSLCASGGYYVAMAVGDQADAIYAEPTTWTGSIGVVIPHYNFSRMMGLLGVNDQSIVSGDLKLMGSPTRRMEDSEREVLQTLVNESFDSFKQIVKSGRPAFRDDEAALDAVATGQVFTAQQALEKGLVDKIGYLEDAIERAAELAGVSTDDVRCVEYNKRVTPIEQLLAARTPAGGGSSQTLDVRSLIELSTPKAYYVYTLLPTMLEGN